MSSAPLNTTRLRALESTWGAWIPLDEARRQCIEIIQPRSRYEYNNFVTECIFNKFNELEKSVFASRQYILTLWPAFIGFICSLGPDPCLMVYDNFWWSLLFGLTCSGLPGMANETPPHHVEVNTTRQGRAKCEGWQYDPDRPHVLSRTRARRDFTSNQFVAVAEWVCFFFSLACYFVFCALFGWSLKDAVTLSFPADQWQQWLAPATWYYISIAPCIWGSIMELVYNRVDVYEPLYGQYTSTKREARVANDNTELSSMHSALLPSAIVAGSLPHPSTTDDNQGDPMHVPHEATSRITSSVPDYRKTLTRSSIHTFLRIIRLQWSRQDYRILVRPRPQRGPLAAINVTSAAFLGLGRITVFALGSIAMGNVLLMPVPHDLALFVLLLFTTAVPRFVWGPFWSSGVRGADLVVWVKPIGGDEV